MKRVMSHGLLMIVLLASPLGAWAEDGFEGSVELLYRNVSVDGSENKYNEDFDGLDSGTRLGSLTANWLSTDSELVDFARLDFIGLGGEPFERSFFRIGRKDAYDLTIRHTKQDYVYNLFELTPDLDGHSWDAERRRTSLNLRVHARDNVDLIFGFEEGRRTGSSLFMKDVERQLFQMETPLDQTVKRYTLGADIRLGEVNIMLRQALRRYDNQFDNSTENDLGLEEGSLTVLDHYAWLQNDSGGSDWTTLRVSGSPGDRVSYVVSLFGTLLGEEEIKSDVLLNADGTSFDGSPYLVDDGTNRTRVDGDSQMIDAELSIAIIDPLDVHLSYRSLDRDLEGSQQQDLDGDGVLTEVDTIHDYQINTSTVMLDYRPAGWVGLRAGYRLIDRELVRTGFLGVRNIDYDSGDDDTLLFGVTARPTDWLRFNADYEDGEITQPFNAVAPQDRDRTSVRATITPRDEMRIDFSFVDFEHRNTAPDIREPGSRWDGAADGKTWSAALWHKASDRIDYLLRYAVQDIETAVGVTFDQADFGGAVEGGDSIFDNDNTQFSGQLNVRATEGWSGYLRWWMAESDGENVLRGDGDLTATPVISPGVRNTQPIDQELRNAEVGVTYTLPSGVYMSAGLRDIDYDDMNDLLDYDGQIFTFRAGAAF